VLAILGVIWLVPVYLLLANASKRPEVFGEYSVWQPGDLGGLLSNMADAWGRGRLSLGTLSTALYAITSPALAVLVGAAARCARRHRSRPLCTRQRRSPDCRWAAPGTEPKEVVPVGNGQ